MKKDGRKGNLPISVGYNKVISHVLNKVSTV